MDTIARAWNFVKEVATNSHFKEELLLTLSEHLSSPPILYEIRVT
jgi:hypothetical protein